jgi:hypothetical protein
VEPVTQRLNVSWRPEVRFLERRLELLRQLDDEGLVQSFSVDGADVLIRVTGRYHEIRFGPSGLGIRLGDPDFDPEVIQGVVTKIFECFDPEVLGQIRADLQFLEALSISYEQARALGGQVLFDASDSDVEITDWAVLLNPEFGATHRWAGALEFGVVSNQEAEVRLARKVGRLDQPFPGPVSQRIEVPEVGFFADCQLQSSSAIGSNEPLQELLAAWATLRSELVELLGKLKRNYLQENTAE